jgi:predicted RNA-binding protein YlqC (UPF0109 family)
MHRAKPLVPGPSRLEVEIAIAKLKKYKSPADLIQGGGKTVSAIYTLINFICYKEELTNCVELSTTR